MAYPNPKVNTFFKQKQKSFIDPISKLYIVVASLLGINRLPVILNETKYILTSFAVAHSVFIITGVYYVTYIYKIYAISEISDLIRYTFKIIFSFITLKRLERYYNELNKFDAEVGCRPKTTIQSINNLVVMVLINVFFTSSYWISFVWDNNKNNFKYKGMPLNVPHCLELFYYGHLLSLVVPRLRHINYFVESTLTNGQDAPCPNVEEFLSFKTKHVKNYDIKNLMDLYYTVIKAYDYLVEAIKWQLLVVIITSFIGTLGFCYDLASDLMSKERDIACMLKHVNLIGMEMVSLFSPCVFGDRVNGEVRRLRELLAARLYEKKLDKSGRGAARALLALTEARDLSFSLMRMLRIDISFPFKFISLLVTYLIILLQFEKVIGPQSATI